MHRTVYEMQHLISYIPAGWQARGAQLPKCCHAGDMHGACSSVTEQPAFNPRSRAKCCPPARPTARNMLQIRINLDL